jgi:hypothetical protein
MHVSTYLITLWGLNYVCTYIYTHPHIPAYIHTQTPEEIHYICAFVSAYTHAYTHTNTNTYTHCIHIYIHNSSSGETQLCMDVCMCVSMFGYMCTDINA